MRVPLVLSALGELLRPFSLVMVVPLALAIWDGDRLGTGAFASGIACTLAVGLVLAFRFERPRVLYRAEALAIVALVWLAVAGFSAVPMIIVGLSPIDAYFEAMSGYTTTGATILVDFSDPRFGRAFFLWRGLMQWIGGLGVVALFVIVLPRLGIGGRQLFFAEASTAPGEAVSPNIRNAAAKLWTLYVVMTAACTLGLVATGMSVFDSVCHAFATLAAGGFSPSSTSLYGYDNPGAEWVLALFMFLSGASFPLQYKVYTGRWKGFYEDGEFKFYLGFTLACTLMCAAVVGSLHDVEGFFTSIRLALFQVTSLISSTGFASIDYNLWPDEARGVLVVAMVVGGCAGSAAGGAKCVRHLLVTKHILRELTQVLHPRAVLPVVYKGRPVPPDALRAVLTLVFLFFGAVFVIGVALVWMGYAPITAFSASLACVGNIGPGFEAVGPMGSYGAFSVAAKALLVAGMWLGRLEIVTVLALFHPHVWRELSLARG